MALNWTTTAKASVNDGLKILNYGRPGMLKTRICATAPAPFIISAESGMLSLRDYNIPALEIVKPVDLDDAYKWVTSSNEARQFKTICVDSATEIAEVYLSSAKKLYRDPRQAYGEMLEKMITKIKDFRDLKGKHVYITAKEGLVKSEETGRTIFGPIMPGKQLGPGSPYYLAYYFDEVFHADVGETADGTRYHFLQTEADHQFDGKERSGALSHIERPDLGYIINKIMKGVNHG